MKRVIRLRKAAECDILETGDRAAFLLAIRHVVQANEGMSRTTRSTGLNRDNLYRLLSEDGNPALASLEKLLANLGARAFGGSGTDDDARRLGKRPHGNLPRPFLY